MPTIQRRPPSITRYPRRQGPRRRLRVDGVLTAVAVAVLALVLVASSSEGASPSEPAINAKGVVAFFGNPTTASSAAAGQFSTANGGIGGVAVNASGAGGVPAGEVYVVDRGNNRVEEFSASGQFVRAFGLNVGGSGVDICTISCSAGTASSAAGGMSDPQGVAIDQSTGNVYVSDDLNRRVDVFSAAGVFEGAFGWGAETGAAELQFCTATCHAPGAAGGAAGQFGFSIGYPTVEPATPHDVYVADTADNRVDQFAVTLTGTKVTGASFVRAFGWDVVSSGPDASGTEVEVCDVVAHPTDVCKAGTAGSGVGQFGGSFFSHALSRVAVDTSGAIYTVEPIVNFRVQSFAPSGGTLAPAIFAESILSGTAASSAPSEVAVDQSSGNVYVTKEFAERTGTPPAAAQESRLLRLSTGGSLLEADLVGAGIASVNGLGVDPTSGELYLSSSSGGVQRVYILGSVTPPAVSFESPTAVTGITAHGATLEGAVNSNGGVDTTYRFEYRLAGTVTWIPFQANIDIGNGETSVAVTQSETGLQANATYGVRLVAAKTFGGPAVVSEPHTLATTAVAPELSTAAPGYSQTQVHLQGTVNPGNLPTTYRFEYGAADCSASPCASTPDVSAGSGATPLDASAVLTALTPESGYHYRLVATNAQGTTVGPDQTFTTLSLLPEGRAYEMVSPPFTQGFDVNATTAYPSIVSPDGSAAFFYSKGAFSEPNNNSGSSSNPYLAARTATGWATLQIYPPMSLIKDASPITDGSANLSQFVNCGGVGGNQNSESAIGVACALRRPDGSWVSSPVYQTVNGVPTGNLNTVTSGQLGESANLSDVVTSAHSGVHLLPSDTATYQGGAGGSLYEIAGLGSASPTLRLVNVDSGGNLIGGASAVSLGGFWQPSEPCGAQNATTISTYQAVSADGSTIYFTACPASGAAQVYARIDGSQTVDVSNPSPSECTTCNPTAKAALFWGASRDGSRVFFTTTQQLLNADTDTTMDLYEYDFNSPHHIVQLSAGGPGDSTPGAGADVQGVLRTSSDGSKVYFVASGLLTTIPNALGQTASSGADNLYAVDVETGQTKFIAQLCSGHEASGSQTDPACPGAGSDQALWAATGPTIKPERPAQTTPDGRYLVFTTNAKLIATGPEADPDTGSDVYRYDFKTGQLIRVSIGEPSSPSSNATIAGPTFTGVNPWGAQADANNVDRAISSDGSTIVFSTTARLQADDVNEASDVYEWHNGTVSLLSDGQDPAGVPIASAGMSEDGSDIFFATHTPLVAQDTGTLQALYDARIGGGIASQNQPPPAPCTDSESCAGQASRPPLFSAPPSVAFTGGMNLAPLVKARPAGKQKAAAKPKPPALSRRQKLTRALKACRKKARQRRDKKANRRRAACARRARKRYGTKPRAKKTKRRSK